MERPRTAAGSLQSDEPEITCSGLGMRVPVSVVLKMLAGGMTREQILEDYPDLEPEDLDECIEYAAMLADDTVAPRVG